MIDVKMVPNIVGSFGKVSEGIKVNIKEIGIDYPIERTFTKDLTLSHNQINRRNLSRDKRKA